MSRKAAKSAKKTNFKGLAGSAAFPYPEQVGQAIVKKTNFKDLAGLAALRDHVFRFLPQVAEVKTPRLMGMTGEFVIV